MKHVRALSGEPMLLAQYRASNPSEEQRPSSEAGKTWEGFKTDQQAYSELLAKLAEAQQGLCIYCEQCLIGSNGKLIPNDYQVEHVLAKSGAVGRVLDWRNLALACSGGTYRHHHDSSRQYTSTLNTSCGQTKGDRNLPQGCDPRSFLLLNPLVEVGIDGRLSVNTQHCATAGVSQSDVEEAIGLLNLNCERLRKARQDRYYEINSWVVPILNELLNATHLNAAQRQQMLDLVIAGRLQPGTRGHLCAFWTTERCSLGPDAETYISNNQGLFQ